jgi:lysophospholipase L1-like esterase
VINRGFGGSTLKECSQQFKRLILPLDPRLLILYAGENDISANQTAISIQSIFRQLIPTIRRFFPLLPLVFISIKPSPSRFNQILQQNLTNHLIQEDIQSMENIYYIDIFNEMLTIDGQPRSDLFISDDLHMNEKGYAIWTRAIQNYLHTNGFISKGFINCDISLVIIVFNLLVFFCFIQYNTKQ